MIERIRADPMTMKDICIRTAACIFDAQDALAGPRRMGCATVIFHGLADLSCSPQASKDFIDALDCPDKTFVGLPDALHSSKPIGKDD